MNTENNELKLEESAPVVNVEINHPSSEENATDTDHILNDEQTVNTGADTAADSDTEKETAEDLANKLDDDLEEQNAQILDALVMGLSALKTELDGIKSWQNQINQSLEVTSSTYRMMQDQLTALSQRTPQRPHSNQLNSEPLTGQTVEPSTAPINPVATEPTQDELDETPINGETILQARQRADRLKHLPREQRNRI